MRATKMHGAKIDAQNLWSKLTSNNTFFRKTLGASLGLSVFLFSTSCVMTRSQGQELEKRLKDLEGETMRLKRARHDMDIMLNGQIRDLLTRLRGIEAQLITFRESLYDGSSKNLELVNEIKSLRNQLEQAQEKYNNIAQSQKVLAKKHKQLVEATKESKIPPIKKDHYSLAKRLYKENKYQESIYLLENFIQKYKNDKNLLGQSYYLLAEINKKLAEKSSNLEVKDKHRKKAVLYYQKIINMYDKSVLKEEALFKLGLVLRALGDKDSAILAFKELININHKSNRAPLAKRHIASIRDSNK